MGILAHCVKKVFLSLGELNVHVQTHTFEVSAQDLQLQFSCTLCPEIFRTLTELNSHVVSHDTQPERSCYAGGNLFDENCLFPVFSLMNSDIHNLAESTQVGGNEFLSVTHVDLSACVEMVDLSTR